MLLLNCLKQRNTVFEKVCLIEIPCRKTHSVFHGQEDQTENSETLLSPSDSMHFYHSEMGSHFFKEMYIIQ